MRIAVLSGKGGTGKTFVATNLAYVANKTTFVDCDVEEPNGWVFLQPEHTQEERVTVRVPVVDAEKCQGCKKCVQFCQFNALAHAGGRLMVFPELCHACGGCMLVCPHKALTEQEREIGIIQYGAAGNISTRTGYLNIGETTGVPVIKKLLSSLPDETVIIDCPPGSSCAVMESIKDCDFCILVTEPTMFGVHNLSLVHELVTLFSKPYGIVLNKAISGETVVEDYCREKGIQLLETIPYDAEIGLINSQGMLAAEERKDCYQTFAGLLGRIGGNGK